ncbi:MAG: DegT/DnrJ/EryC1/StrS family aminotransferase, partial [Maribacter sp.]
DRGAESHPFLGYNFRISELNAAVGCAQIERLDDFIAIQKKNYEVIRKSIESVNGVTFRRIPVGGIENYSFLNFFLPSTEIAKKAHKALTENGIDACFYWFNNNWHYYKKWNHLSNLKSLGNLPQEVKNQLPDYAKSDFSKSDEWMGRTISCLIKLSWTDDQVKERAEKMKTILSDIL